MPIEWKYVGETSFEGTQVAQAEQEDREAARYNQGVQEIMSRHLQRQALRAQEINSVPAPEIPQGFTPGTGESVALDQPVPPRNQAPGGLLPLSVPGSKELRGYVDAEGKVTPAGKQFYKLMQEGLFDMDGLPTPKGKAFMMDPETAMGEEHLDAFIIRDQAGLNRAPDQSWGQTFATMAAEVGGAASAMHKLGRFTGADKIYDPFRLFAGDGKRPTTEDAAEAVLTGITFAEGSIEAGAPLAAGGLSASRKLGALLKGDTREFYAAKQQHERDKDMLETLKLGDYLALIDDSAKLSGAVNNIQEATRGILGDKAPEIERRGRLAGNIIGDPANIATAGAGFLFGTASKAPIMFNMAGNVERAVIARATASRFAMEAELARGSAARTVKAAEIAAQRAADLRGMGQQIDRAARLESTATRLAAHAETQAKAFPVLAEKAKASMMLAEKLTQQAGGADEILAMMQATKAARAVPFEAVGNTLEAIGDKVLKVSDDASELLTRHGWKPGTMEKIRSAIGPVGGAAVGAAFGGPVGAFLGGTAGRIGQAFASAPFIKQLGQFTRTVGRELVKERGSVPFWQRVANHSELSPVARVTAHLADMATLGGRAGVPVRALKKGAQGAMLTAPMNVAFETITDGGEITEAAFQRGIAGASIFGGVPAALGGLVQGSILARRAKMAGNEINFRQGLAGDQSALFASMPQPARRVVTESAAAFPSLGWKFTEGANSFYDPRANTIVVGKNSNRLLEAMLAHEVSHSISYKGQMEAGITAALVGTEGTGGLFRSKDGTLDPHFREFMDTYNRDADAQGLQPLSVEQAAIEYFTDSTVKDILEMTESGEMQRMAGRTQARRIASEIGRAVIGKAPLLSDFFYKIGGATDKGGKLVPGTGILQDGIRTLPGAQKMLREYMREKAGRTGETGTAKAQRDAPVAMELAKASKPLLDTMAAVFETDAAGNVLYFPDGHPRFITNATDIRRAACGHILTEAIQKRMQAGEIPAKGELRPVEGGGWEGRYVPEHAIKELAASGVLNGRQIANLRLLNNGAKRNTGELFFVVYQPGTIKRKGKSAAYGSLSPTFRDVVPLAVSVTGQGNLLVHLFSATQFDKNATKRAGSARGKELYAGDLNAIKADAQAMMEAHASRGESKSYFVEKYGPKDAEAHLNFINSIFVTDTAAQRGKNPLFDADKIPEKAENVYKTYRLDRINQATRLQGVPMPFDYEMMRERMLPTGFRLNIAPNGIPEPTPAPAPRPNMPAFGGELLETR